MSASIEKNVISFLAHDVQVEVHRHHCFQILLSVSASFSSRIGGVVHEGRRALVIGQNVAHACNGLGGSNLIFFIDADSRTGWQLKQMLDGQAVLDLSDMWLEVQPDPSSLAEVHGWSHAQRRDFAERSLALLTADARADGTRDERIELAIAWVEAHLHERIALPDVAAQIHLSPERTRHLFVQEAGVAFSQFLMWKRIKAAIVQAVGAGASLTEAAACAGFADQAHFCRLFRRTFGIPAGGLLQNSRSIQFIHPQVG